MKKYSNEAAFDVLDSTSEYWLGWLMGDGYIGTKTNDVKLDLGIIDKGHVEKFKRFMQSEHKISESHKDKSFALRIKSKKLKSSLMYYGVVPNKSTKEELTNHPMSWTFLRGLYEADGSFKVSKSRAKVPTGDEYAVEVSSSKKMCEDIKDFFISEGIDVSGITPYPRKESPNLYVLKVSGRAQATEIAARLYEGATPDTVLDRKQKNVNKMIKFNQRHGSPQQQPSEPAS